MSNFKEYIVDELRNLIVERDDTIIELRRKIAKYEHTLGLDVPIPPKRKFNSYTYFFMEFRPLMSKNNPHMGFAELTRYMAQEWKALSASEKAKYNDMAVNRNGRELDKWTKECKRLGYTPREAREIYKRTKKR